METRSDASTQSPLHSPAPIARAHGQQTRTPRTGVHPGAHPTTKNTFTHLYDVLSTSPVRIANFRPSLSEVAMASMVEGRQSLWLCVAIWVFTLQIPIATSRYRQHIVPYKMLKQVERKNNKRISTFPNTFSATQTSIPSIIRVAGIPEERQRVRKPIRILT